MRFFPLAFLKGVQGELFLGPKERFPLQNRVPSRYRELIRL